MKRQINWLLILLIGVPLCLWGLAVVIGSMLPEKREVEGITVPRPIARDGYEIIFPDVYAMGPDKGNFYYLSVKRQIIYRYDTNRYLELQGENCEGLIWYHDELNNIHTRLDEVFFTADKLPKFNYFNPGKEYIGVPTQDLTAVMFSIDGGKVFRKADVTSYAAVPSELIERFIGNDDQPLTVSFKDTKPEDSTRFINTITISGNTGYFILKNGDVIFGETVFYDNKKFKTITQEFHILNHAPEEKSRMFGGYVWEIYHDPVYIDRIENAKKLTPEPYQGWDKIRCEIGAEK